MMRFLSQSSPTFFDQTGSDRRSNPVRSFFALLLAASAAVSATGADDKEALKFFENEVRPLLAADCFGCHGSDKQKGGLRLDHINFIKKGGGSGPALVAGKPTESLIAKAVHRKDPDLSMPPKDEDALSPEKIAVLEKWISLGAPWPADSVVAGATDVDEHGFTKEDREWWAAQPVIDPKIPAIEYSAFKDQYSESELKQNPVDAFVLRKLSEAKLKPAPKASKEELVRRAYLDLHGMPPTPEQVTAFVKDDSPDAWPKLIDELLASPRYGERWAQHWLDVVRYAESDGYRADDFRSGVWKYRDYVIRSLNDDKPYDQFVREQLAADEIAAEDPDTLIATAFLRLGIYEWNQRNARMQWDLIMTEMTNVTGEAFLGLGIGCAECHDHKFDPILQKDHFALQAFLNATWWPEHEPIGTPAEKAEFAKKQSEWEAATKDIRDQIDAMQKARIESSRKGTAVQFPEDVQKIYNTPTEKRTAYEEQIAQLVQRQVDKAQSGIKWETEFEKRKDDSLARYKALTTELAKFDSIKPVPLPLGFIATDVKPTPGTTIMKKRKTQEEVEPAFLTLLNLPAPKIEPTKYGTTGRRLALANWIADEKNPFSTRVIVNRLWQRHFGQGIVATPNDLGMLGEKPSHPELLDWLTSRFLEGGWKMKPIHRLIMTSAAYQQTARREPTTDEVVADPGNTLLWRFPPQRLQAEQVRDAMLITSGEMTDREGGASVDGNELVRSVYLKKRRNTPDPIMGGFDAPSGFSSSPDRISTTTPTQSLLLVNSEWAMSRAKAFANRLLAGKGEVTESGIRDAFQQAFGRAASADEIAASLAFIESQAENISAAKAPAAKYPNETGLRPVKEKFGNVTGVELGKNALWLQPDSRFSKLDFSKIELPTEEFTIEAVADLDTVYPNSNVNTLVARWNGSNQETGWAFGVTSEKSRFKPRNFIMQLTGPDFQNNIIYEVVASDLRFPERKPAYFAAVVSAKPSASDPAKGSVTFYLKELDRPDAPMQKNVVPHDIVGGLTAEDVRSLIGGRDQNGHSWDGQLARMVISRGALTENELFINADTKSPSRVVDFSFSGNNGAEPEAGTVWAGSDAAPSNKDPRLLGAVTDFCHALLTSNEFLYLH